MAGIGRTPCRAMVAEYIRDLQRWARHECRVSSRRFSLGFVLIVRLVLLGHPQSEAIQRAPDLTEDGGGDLGVERRALELGVSEQS